MPVKFGGDGKPNYSKAIELFELAAEECKDCEAINNLGVYFQNDLMPDDGLDNDLQAFKHYELSNQVKTNCLALNNLGTC